jgi:hypothetical protein
LCVDWHSQCQPTRQRATRQRASALQELPAASSFRTHRFLLRNNDTATESCPRGREYTRPCQIWPVPMSRGAHDQGLGGLAARGWLIGLVRQGTDGPCRHGAAGTIVVASCRINPASEQAAAKARRTRETVSMTRAPSLSRRRRMVANSPASRECDDLVALREEQGVGGRQKSADILPGNARSGPKQHTQPSHPLRLLRSRRERPTAAARRQG